MNEILLYGGIITMSLSAFLGISSMIYFKLYKKNLDIQLDLDYGEND